MSGASPYVTRTELIDWIVEASRAVSAVRELPPAPAPAGARSTRRTTARAVTAGRTRLATPGFNPEPFLPPACCNDLHRRPKRKDPCPERIYSIANANATAPVDAQ